MQAIKTLNLVKRYKELTAVATFGFLGQMKKQ